MIDLKDYRSGHYEKGLSYKFFVPSMINDGWTWSSPEINFLLEQSAISLGELNSFARLVPNVDLFLMLHVTKEAVESSRIEGTKTNMSEAILPVEEVDPERRNDWQEVSNYINALNHAIEDLKTLPISTRLIKKAHGLLLDSVRGETRLPGEFRRSQNWIGGNSLADASFIPPHDRYVNELMGDLENFLHNDEIHLPTLIKIAIAHYQFETIHPFLDGNGRIGRLLIPLFLVSEKKLEKPLLYLSAYFEKNKELYYDNLTRVRTHSDMHHWIKYFLVGIDQAASEAVSKLNSILQLKEQAENLIKTQFGRRSSNGFILLQSLFKNPAVNVEKVSEICECSYKAANDLVSDFQKHQLLKELTGRSRNRFYIFEPYIKVF